MKSVRWFLDHLGDGDRERFVAAQPRFVLVEIEAGDETAGSDLGVTERIDAAAIQRQSRSSGDARVLGVSGQGAEGRLSVGRSRRCDLVVDHPSVSKEHARLEVSAERVTVEDLGSTNGTFVNSRKLAPGTPAVIRPDDLVRFGEATGFQFMDSGGFFDYLRVLRRFGF